jgi:hypothetical protein
MLSHLGTVMGISNESKSDSPQLRWALNAGRKSFGLLDPKKTAA